MFALFFMIAFVTGLQNPMGIIVKEQFQVPNWMSQLGNFANFIAYACMGIPAGIMLQRIGYKKTALTAIVVGFVGVGISFLSGQVESFTVYLIGAFVSGFSMCMLNAVVNPMLNTLGGGGNRGNQLVQFGGSCNSIGATIVPVLVGYLMGDVYSASISKANPALFLAMGIFALAFIVLSFVKIPEPHLVTAKKEKEKHSPFSFRHFVLGTLAIFFYVGVEVGIANFANLFMTQSVDKGGLAIDTTVAGTIAGTYWFLMLIGRLTGASLGAKFSSKSMLTFVSSLGILLILLFSRGTGLLGLLPAQGFPDTGWATPGKALSCLLLPALTTGITAGASIMRYTRAAVGDMASSQAVDMAMACGMTRKQAVLRVALRLATAQLVSVVGLTFAQMITGVMVVENLFALPGLGAMLVTDVGNRDLIAVQSELFLLAAFFLLLGLVVDLTHRALDPRLKHSGVVSGKAEA